MKTYRLKLTMLSPVHIGTGEELSPDEYVVDRLDKDNYRLRAIDLPALFSGLSPQQRQAFDLAAGASSVSMLYRFIADNADRSRHVRWQAATNEELFNLYRRGLEDPSGMLAVHPMPRTGLNSLPYVPGSSIKGAIRTAVIQRIIDSRPGWAETLARSAGRGSQRDVQALEAQVLGCLTGAGRAEIRADPFRAVRITDCTLPDSATSIDPVDLVSLRPGPAAGDRGASPIRMFYEMTFSALDGEEVRAEGALALDEGLFGTPVRRSGRWDFPHCVSRAVAAREILDACSGFYLPRLEQEKQRAQAARPALGATYARLLELAGGLASNQAIIRLGRFSHVECVTLAPPLRRASGGMSRGLAAGQLPMGWAAISLEGEGL
jgi:CRISPR-associated protein Csm5